MRSDLGCVVIGAGLAAANVVQTLREKGYNGPITLIGDEKEPPYERPPLSKDYLQGKAELDTVFVHDKGWYSEHQIDARFGETVTSIDRQSHTVTLKSGGTIGYQQLVIATGCSARILDIPGAELAGVHTLRRIGDSEALKSAFAKGKQVVLIGGGWIGLEVAAAARNAGCDVTVLENAEVPLGHVLGEEMGRYFAGLHRSNGVDLRTEISVTEILGSDGAVAGVQTGAGTIDAELVVIAVGATPNTQLAGAAGLDLGRGHESGILVDEHLRTSDRDILAAGDVANARNTVLGRRLRVEHWDNAIRQGKLAAESILNGDASYDWQPYFFTDQFDLGMEYVGNAGADDDVVIRGDKDKGEFVAFWLKDGRVRAAMNVNIWDVSDDLRALIGRVIAVDRLTDTDVELADLSPLSPDASPR